MIELFRNATNIDAGTSKTPSRSTIINVLIRKDALTKVKAKHSRIEQLIDQAFLLLRRSLSHQYHHQSQPHRKPYLSRKAKVALSSYSKSMISSLASSPLLSSSPLKSASEQGIGFALIASN